MGSRPTPESGSLLEKKKETVNHPEHYSMIPAKCDKCGEPIECISIVRHMSFNLGNAIKYIWRSDFKDKSVEDLRKAIWYLEDEINKQETKIDRHKFRDNWKEYSK